MIKFFPMASSSSGNVTWVTTDKASILIDCGTTLKFLKDTLGASNLENLDAVFITHEHTDHVKGVGPLGRKYTSLPFYMNEWSKQAKEKGFEGVTFKKLNAGDEIVIGDLAVIPFTTRHDAKNAFGFTIEQKDGPKICYLTDTGSITRLMRHKIEGTDLLFLETDYDPDSLDAYEEYNEDLKNRIRSNFGHLGNDQAIDLIKEVGVDSPNKIIFGHLSPRTNTPELVKVAFNKEFNEQDKVLIAPLETPVKVFKDGVELE